MPQVIVGFIIVICLIAVTIGQFGGCGKGLGDGGNYNKNQQTQVESPKEDNPKPQKTPPKPKVSVIKIQMITIERDKDNDRINYIVFDNGNKTIVNNEDELEQILNDSLSNLAEKVEVKCDGNDDYRITIEAFLKDHNKYNN